eukprot:TRINITY_DN80527_c11_g1_i5.p1 TRINITY_DN80527_c11_g1~~TRINITY_DN80527_c11_g1_i5.p1  ORF type:complete len:852 (-),score=124.22 TRINITY_DN80527_c11_g1_i5:1501-4056(-)
MLAQLASTQIWGIQFRILFTLFVLWGMISCDNQAQLHQLPNKNVGALWFYKDPDTAEEAVSKQVYPVTTNWKLELVDGVALDYALRLDGYSTWVQGMHHMNTEIDELTLSVWVALTTYPCNTGALFALDNNMIVQVDSLGYLTVLLTAQYDNQITFQTGIVLPRYEWFHLALAVVPDEMVFVYINGEMQYAEAMNSEGYAWPASGEFYIGRHPDADEYFGFDRNVMNGIIDGIVLYGCILSNAEIWELAHNNKSTGNLDLHVPKSRFAQDFNRPRYHLLPEASWTNEPNGFVYYNGTYHIFNQKNGNGPYWWLMNMGHFTSTDLVTWTEQQIALWPQPGGDQAGIWSGHTVISDEGVPTTVYTGVDGSKAGVFVATSNEHGQDQELLWWKKSEQNPVIPQRPASFPGSDFRDPYVWKDEESGKWNLIIGSGIFTDQGLVGGLFLYKSDDLVNWEFVDKPFFLGDPRQMGGMAVGQFWEMPVLTFMNGKAVLLVNRTPVEGLRADVLYWVGQIVEDVFVPYNPMPRTLELLVCDLAPTVVRDSQDRLVAISITPDTWIAFEQDWVEHYNLGWANIMSLPKLWTLDDNGKILKAPYPELQKLRDQHVFFRDVDLQQSVVSCFNNSLSGLQLEVIAKFQPGQSTQQLGFVLLKSPDGTEQTRIYYDFSAQQIVVDRSRSSLNPNAVRDVTTGSYPLSYDQYLVFHLFLDHSSVEVFVNYNDSFSTRVFTTQEQSALFDLHVVGDGAKLVSMDLWKLRAADEVRVAEGEADVMHGYLEGEMYVDDYGLGQSSVGQHVRQDVMLSQNKAYETTRSADGQTTDTDDSAIDTDAHVDAKGELAKDRKFLRPLSAIAEM